MTAERKRRPGKDIRQTYLELVLLRASLAHISLSDDRKAQLMDGDFAQEVRTPVLSWFEGEENQKKLRAYWRVRRADKDAPREANNRRRIFSALFTDKLLSPILATRIRDGLTRLKDDPEYFVCAFDSEFGAKILTRFLMLPTESPFNISPAVSKSLQLIQDAGIRVDNDLINFARADLSGTTEHVRALLMGDPSGSSVIDFSKYYVEGLAPEQALVEEFIVGGSRLVGDVYRKIYGIVSPGRDRPFSRTILH